MHPTALRLSKFQLTPSRRATPTVRRDFLWYCISTHALTEGDIFFFHHSDNHIISTHALTEGDICQLLFSKIKKFQLTPSRRATLRMLHSLLQRSHFNSRPHGGRPVLDKFNIDSRVFQLTPSRRATDSGRMSEEDYMNFNSRPHGGRRCKLDLSRLEGNFNSRPHGGRPELGRSLQGYADISTHALTEGDEKSTAAAWIGKISTHALTEGD